MNRKLASLLMVAIVLSFSGSALAQARKTVDKKPASGKGQIVPGPDLVTPDSEPRKVVYRAFKRLCEMKSFRTRKVIQLTTSGVIIVKISEFVGPDRRRTVLFVRTDAEFEETITIGPRTYRWSNGTWTEMKLSDSENDELGIKCLLEKDLDNLPQNLKSVGTGEVSGVKALLYRWSIGSGRYEVTYSIGVKDGLLCRIEQRSGVYESGSTEPEGYITTTTHFSDYNAPMAIEPPV